MDEIRNFLAYACRNTHPGKRSPEKLMSQTWQDYCLECVEEARGYATQNGKTIQTAMLHILSVIIPEALARFPDLDLSVALHELAW